MGKYHPFPWRWDYTLAAGLFLLAAAFWVFICTKFRGEGD